MVPQHRRQQLAGRRGGEVAGGGAGPHRCPQDNGQDHDRVERLNRHRRTLAEAQLVGHGARGEVVRRGDRGADRAQDRQPCGPGVDAADERGDNRRRREHYQPDTDRGPTPGQDRPDEQDGRLELHDRADRRGRAEPDRSVHPSPADGEAQEQDGANLPQLDRVGERPRKPRQQECEPADVSAHGHDGDPNQKSHEQRRCPAGDVEGRREQGERQGEEGERRRVVIQPCGTRLVDRGVVEHAPLEQPPSGVEIGLRVVAEGRAGTGQDRAEDHDGNDDCRDRQ